jgi:hypothetical protein
MRLVYSALLVLLAAEAPGAPAPLPKRPVWLPPGTVEIDFSPIGSPPNARWWVDLYVVDARGNHACLGQWTGSAGASAPAIIAGRIERALREHYGGWLTVRRDSSGKRLILTSKPPAPFQSVKVGARGLPARQNPTARPLR